MGKVFKRAAFGGFRKKDVVDYLDVLGQERRIEAARFDEELMELEKRCKDLSEELRLARKTAGDGTGAKEQILRLSEELTAERGRFEARERQLLEQLQGAEARNSELAARISGLEQTLQALDAEKADLAGQLAALTQKLAQQPEEPVYTSGISLPPQLLLEEGADPATNRRLLADMKERLIEVVEEINRLMGAQDGQPGPLNQAESRPDPEKTNTKLSSVNDILFYVKRNGDLN